LIFAQTLGSAGIGFPSPCITGAVDFYYAFVLKMTKGFRMENITLPWIGFKSSYP
jgi:hypothetical protein